uniref:Uncharacterized protein n=1 Tax=Arion vulgaris TaxID=1028688 RepID=A0A0B7ASV0_9EUPU
MRWRWKTSIGECLQFGCDIPITCYISGSYINADFTFVLSSPNLSPYRTKIVKSIPVGMS